MSGAVRYREGTRVAYRKQGKGKPRRATIVSDCADWHSFATVRLDGETAECSVWVGEVEALPGGGFLTSYCNHPHSLATGKPIRHGCYILPPEALELERQGFSEGAIEIIERAKPLRPYSGVRFARGE